MDISDKALAILIGCEYAVYDWKQASNWADEIIKNSESPDINIIELALSTSKESTITYLNKLAKDGDASKASRIVLGYLEKSLNSGFLTVEEVSKILYFMSQDEFEPDVDVGGDMSFFWDGLDLARNGTIERSYDQVEQQMRKLLSENKA